MVQIRQLERQRMVRAKHNDETQNAVLFFFVTWCVRAFYAVLLSRRLCWSQATCPPHPLSFN